MATIVGDYFESAIAVVAASTERVGQATMSIAHTVTKTVEYSLDAYDNPLEVRTHERDSGPGSTMNDSYRVETRSYTYY